MKNTNYSTQKERFISQTDMSGRECTVTRCFNAVKDEGVIGVDYIVRTGNDDARFTDLTLEEQMKATAWIRENLIPKETPLESSTSYGLKHVLERRTNIYMTNNQFKEAMIACGFYPVEVDAKNWWYCISKTSPALKRQADEQFGLLIPECVMDYRDR